MKPVLIDANLSLALVLPLPYSQKAESRIDSWFAQGRRLLVPLLWEYEIASALRKAEWLGVVPAQRVADCLHELWALRFERIPPSPELHARAIQWSRRLGQSKAYDGQYLASAEVVDGELWTADGPLAEQARRLGVQWVYSV